MGKITFHSEGVPYVLPNKALFRQWITETALSHGKTVGELAFVFCSDQYLLEMNKQYLDHDYFTDIITFDYTDGEMIAGDIFISVDRVEDNACKNLVDKKVEMQRVVIHGVLHLCGYKDKQKEESENMRKLEDLALSKYPQKQ